MNRHKLFQPKHCNKRHVKAFTYNWFIVKQTCEIMVKIGEFEVPEGLYYSKDFFWLKIEGEKVRCGLTDYAQKMLKSIVYVDAPREEEELTQSKVCGSVESVKSVSDIVSPLSGKIIEFNQDLDMNAGIINDDPYNKGWIFIIEPKNLDTDLGNLMDHPKAVEWHKEKLENKNE